MPTHAIVHVDIPSRDPASNSKFYTNLFGWQLREFPELNYTTFSAEPGPGGGFPSVDGDTNKAGEVLIYVSTDDINASLARAEAAGGRTLTPLVEIPGQGAYAVFTDPEGNRIGLYRDAAQAA